MIGQPKMQWPLAAALVSALALSACGGGGSGGAPAPAARSAEKPAPQQRTAAAGTPQRHAAKRHAAAAAPLPASPTPGQAVEIKIPRGTSGADAKKLIDRLLHTQRTRTRPARGGGLLGHVLKKLDHRAAKATPAPKTTRPDGVLAAALEALAHDGGAKRSSRK